MMMTIANSYSAFWGQSFVSELTRISTHSAEKFQSKMAMAASAHVGAHVNGAEIPNEGQLTHH